MTDLLDEICDDPDDAGSDYGRGYERGLAAGRKQAAAAVRAAAEKAETDDLTGPRAVRHRALLTAARIAEGSNHAD